ncbi:MAG: hypothetical protein AB3N63_11665 [Puniceicoccaceae bacterium]
MKTFDSALRPILFILLIACAGTHAKDLTDYEVFTDGFPRTLFFRSGDIVKWHNDGVFDHHMGMFDADTRKYAGEETPFRQDWIDIMAGFKERHPRKLSLIHLNGEARGVYRKEGHKYFPGHWTLYPGELLQQDLSADDKRVSVGNPKLFSSRTYRKRERTKLTDRLLPPVIIVPLNPDGSKQWSESEYAEILSIDEAGKMIELDRGQYFSKARAFTGQRAYIAPIHCEYWGSGTMWTLNLSATCPKDPQGRAAVDIWLDEISEWCGPGGPAEHVDGIGFDVIFFKAKNAAWDIDADGESDAGVADSGQDFNTLGQYQMLKRLRERMGPDFILTSDSWDHRMQRAVGIFDGMESEGLCMPNDGWRKFSQTINTQRYWAEQGNSAYKYSYITSKLRHLEDLKIADQLYRMGLGTACALGVSYTEARLPKRKDGLTMIPEMHRGSAMEPNWLGMPLDEMIMLPQRSADVWNSKGTPFTRDILQQLETKACKVSLDGDGTLIIEGTSANPYDAMEVTLPGIVVPEGDLTVFFEALAIEPLAGYASGDRIPRQIFVHADGMPATPADQIGNRAMYNDIMALMGTNDWQENSAYFRKAGDGSGTITLTLRIENQGACKIRNMSAHLGPMGILREFDNGLVLVNASQEPVDFDLGILVPQAVANGLWKIRANTDDYLPGQATDRMLKIHDGRKLDSAVIEVPPLDALFLCKTSQ